MMSPHVHQTFCGGDLGSSMTVQQRQNNSNKTTRKLLQVTLRSSILTSSGAVAVVPPYLICLCRCQRQKQIASGSITLELRQTVSTADSFIIKQLK